MAEETSLLQQVFAETGAQLDRIIDAYKRKGPESENPYIRDSFPLYIRMDLLSCNSSLPESAVGGMLNPLPYVLIIAKHTGFVNDAIEGTLLSSYGFGDPNSYLFDINSSLASTFNGFNYMTVPSTDGTAKIIENDNKLVISYIHECYNGTNGYDPIEYLNQGIDIYHSTLGWGTTDGNNYYKYVVRFLSQEELDAHPEWKTA